MKFPCAAIFYDLDGTLTDTIDDLADAANATLQSYNFPTHDVEAYKYFVGDGIETLFRRCAPKTVAMTTIKELVCKNKEMYAKNWACKSKPYAGITEMLQKLIARKIPLAVLSNKPDEFTQVVVKHFFPNIPFSLIQGSPLNGKAKPDPALALAMAKKLDICPADIMFMGDTRTDMQTATNAGMIPVGVLWGFRPKSELVAYGAKIILEAPQDLFAYI